jgi:antitoxin ParD1/3/4
MDGVAVVDGAIYSRFWGVVTKICCDREVCRCDRNSATMNMSYKIIINRFTCSLTIEVNMLGSYEIGSQLNHFVEDLVSSGRYNSKNEVVREGLRLLQEREQLRQIKLEEVRKAFQEGINSGRDSTANAVFDRLEAKYAAIAEDDQV